MSPYQPSVRIIALAALLILTAGFALGQTVQLTPASPGIDLNGTQTFTVAMAGMPAMQGSHMQLVFDNSALEFVSAANGNVFTGSSDVFQTLVTSVGSTSTLTVDQAIIGGSPVSGSGTLFTVTFKGIAGASASPLGLSGEFRDPLNASIAVTVTGGSLTVNNPAPTLTGLSETSRVAGAGPLTLTVTGTNFLASSVINFNGAPLTTVYGSGTSLSATLDAGVAAGAYPVTVTNPAPGGGTSGALNITVTAAAVNPVNCNVTLDPSGVTADGSSTTTITVTARDTYGNLVPGQAVVLAATGSGNTLTQPSGPTNASGVATGTLASTVAEQKTVSATVAGLSIPHTVNVMFIAGGVSASVSTAVANPASLTANGTDVSTITVTVTDANGNPLVGQGVVLSVSGTGNTVVQPSPTNLSGVTTGTLASTVAETKTITVTAAGVELTTHPIVTFVAGAIHHFAIDEIVGQTSGTPFSITVTAMDQYGNTVTTFAGSLTLSTTATGISPATSSSAFSNGVMTQTVTVTGTGTATISVSDGSHTGTSNVFALAAAPQVYLRSGASSASSILYPHTNWNTTVNDPNDWDFTAAPVLTFYVVPDAGLVFNAFSITLTWDEGEVVYTGAGAGSTGGLNFVATPGTNSVTISNNAGSGVDLTTVAGDFLATVTFTISKPGYADVRMSSAAFSKATSGAFLVVPNGGEIKAYLGDVASAGPNFAQGDGLIDIVDLSPWTGSYWSGVPGYAGMSDYKAKYDIGPTADDYVFSLPAKDGRIDFEDLVIFSIEYGLSGTPTLPKKAVMSESPIEFSLGKPVVMGNETRIAVMLGGAVNDLRAVSLQLQGEFGIFLGADKGSLLQSYATPVLVMDRSEQGRIFIDMAIAGFDAQGVSSTGELLVLRFDATPAVRLAEIDARNSLNMAFNTTNAQTAAEGMPTEYRMSQNYPNPFNPTTVVNYQVPVAGNVSLVVYDMTGRQVATLVNDMKEAGYHQAQWDGRDMHHRAVASGVYFYRIQAGEFSSVMRMMLLK